MVWGAIASAGASLLGGHLARKGTQDANRANIKLARERMQFEYVQAARAMNFQERMSSTAVQRRMDDLRKAGINPMLAGSFDASTPSGALGQGDQITVQIEMLPAVNSAMAVRRLAEDLKIMKQDFKNKKAIEELNKSQKNQADATTLKENMNAADKAVEIQLKQLQLPEAKLHAQLYESAGGEIVKAEIGRAHV